MIIYCMTNILKQNNMRDEKKTLARVIDTNHVLFYCLFLSYYLFALFSLYYVYQKNERRK
jgi:hypothetical protein